MEVTTLDGALEGVPALLRLLQSLQIKASFFLSLGPDYSKIPLKSFLPDALIRRMPVHFIAHRARDSLLAIAEAGHEVGLSSYTPYDWQRDTAYRDRAWVQSEVSHAVERFYTLFGQAPAFYGASGWQINAHLLSIEDEFGFDFASDVRGQHAFYPELQGICSNVAQLPTTLPRMDELFCQPGVSTDNVHQYIFAQSQRVLPNGEIFSLCAEREGMTLLSELERLLTMWKGGGGEIKPLGALYDSIKGAGLKRHQVGWDRLPGQSGYLAMQSIVTDKKE